MFKPTPCPDKAAKEMVELYGDCALRELMEDVRADRGLCAEGGTRFLADVARRIVARET